MSTPILRAFNDRYDTHERYTTSLIQQQRQEQASAYHHRATGISDYSRPSSSAGSAHTLRRTPRLDDVRSLGHTHSKSVGSRRHPSPEPTVRTPPLEPPAPRPSHRRATSAYSHSQPPHPALRTSGRTHAAILFTLEEAIRHPNSFTPDLEEENAQMSDLGGGRASNGGARSHGPVPVAGSGTPSGIRTPRDVMRDRNAREARRQEEQKAEEARRLAEERRRSVERRAAAVTGSSQRPQSQYQQDPSQHHGFDGAGDRRSGTGKVSGSDAFSYTHLRAHDTLMKSYAVFYLKKTSFEPRINNLFIIHIKNS